MNLVYEFLKIFISYLRLIKNKKFISFRSNFFNNIENNVENNIENVII